MSATSCENEYGEALPPTVEDVQFPVVPRRYCNVGLLPVSVIVPPKVALAEVNRALAEMLVMAMTGAVVSINVEIARE